MKPGDVSVDTAYWKRIDALLGLALALPPMQRAAWLASLEGEEAALRGTLAGMLERAQSQDGAFMERPVAGAIMAAATEEVHGDKPGVVIGPYRLIRLLGGGGMGTVWSAEREDGAVQRVVALKLPRAGWAPGVADRLKHECGVLSTLEHPGIARLYDAGVAANGRPWLAMEMIDGVPIDEHCRVRALGVPQRLRLFLQVAEAIAFAHARLVVHRDLKPSNVMVDREGRVHVVDFGLAKLLGARAGTRSGLTLSLGRSLTPDYASPEQIRGDAVTVGSDVYSLGVVLYELLVGERPYRLRRDTAAALEEAIVEADIPPPSTRAKDRGTARALRGDLDTILGKALRKDANDRYPTVEAFAADIERHLQGIPVRARPASLPYRAQRFVRRNRTVVAASAAVAVATLVGVVATLHQARLAGHEARLAAIERDKALQGLRIAEGTGQFMRFLLSEQSRKPLPAPELLRRAESTLGQQFADDPSLRARLQMQVADLYGELSDFKAAAAVAAAARASAQLSGDRWLVLQADCIGAAVLQATGRGADAMATLNNAVILIDADPRPDPATAQVCLSERSKALRSLGRGEDAARDAQSALKHFDASASGNRLNRIILESNVGDAMVTAGRTSEAIGIYERAIGELGRMGRGGTSTGMLLGNNIIVILSRAGQLRRAAEAYARIAPGNDPDRPTLSTLGINYAKVLAELGHPVEADRILEEAWREKVRLGDKRGEAFAVLAAAQIACGRDELARCEKLADEATRKLRGQLPPAHSAFATLRYLYARAALARGDGERARTLLEQSVRHFEAAPDRNLLSVRALALLAHARQARGDAAGAREAAASAVATARRATPGFEASEWLGSALLSEAMLLRDQGDREGARALLTEARHQLATSAGADAPAARKADALARALSMPRRNP